MYAASGAATGGRARPSAARRACGEAAGEGMTGRYPLPASHGDGLPPRRRGGISYAGEMVATRAATKGAPPPLADGIPAQARLHVVTGKGGTGKTTVAAALALALA